MLGLSPRADYRDSNDTGGWLSRYSVVEVAAARSCPMRCLRVHMAVMAKPEAVDAIHCNSRATFCSSLRAVLCSSYFLQVMGLYAPQE